MRSYPIQAEKFLMELCRFRVETRPQETTMFAKFAIPLYAAAIIFVASAPTAQALTVKCGVGTSRSCNGFAYACTQMGSTADCQYGTCTCTYRKATTNKTK